MSVFNTKVTLPSRIVLCAQASDGMTDAVFQEHLEKVYLQVTKDKNPILCNCNVTPRLKLTIRQRNRSDGTTRYYLARYPKTSDKHVKCWFYALPNEASGRAGYTDSVIEETEDGFSIRLAHPLVSRLAKGTQKAPASTPATHTGPGTPRKNKMTTLGFLNFLWEQANLHDSGDLLAKERKEASVIWRLQNATQHISAGDESVSDHFLALPTAPTKEHRDRLEKLVERQTALKTDKDRTLCIIVGHLSDLYATQITCTGAKQLELQLVMTSALSKALKVAGGISAQALTALATRKAARADVVRLNKQKYDENRPAFTPSEQLALDAAHARSAKAPHAIFCCLAYLEKTASGVVANVVDAAIMPVSAHWIPYASSFELQVSDELVQQKRHFIKPLRYDAATDLIFPDFILSDTQTPTPMEVFGRTDETYQQRKAEKTAYYQQHFSTCQWWHWIAQGVGSTPIIPVFPPKV
ncbi:DUF1173 family protein [Pseudomonas abieticivorans]|uniref:DUF1173 family protein n=1 Tax=Pseudomonas abieticivorans TaxID=2931382 RepID=UPI0020BE46FC|nr:DUF1173 family protein [Pseudomonas sp. PIA16]